MSPMDLDMAAREWRPQRYGRRSHRKVNDPVIEPLWSGVRVLVHASPASTTIRDAEGADVTPDHPEIAAAIGQALRAEMALIDGYLTQVAARDTIGMWAGPDTVTPSLGRITRQLLVGGGGRDREAELQEAARARLEDQLYGDDPVAFVAIDLLWLDRDELLEVPLLERKRHLDSILLESDLVRLGTFVREPIHPWLGQWRAFGFRELAFKAANSRYTPGLPNDAWATVPIPRR